MARHCTECWKTGHNKRTCPTLTERYLRYAKGETEENEGIVNPTGYWTLEYAKRTGKYPDGSKAPVGTKKKQKRQCTWCKSQFGEHAEQGYDHNRRTCPHRKEWNAEFKAKAIKYRQDFVKRMKEAGFGIGTLVRRSEYDYYPTPVGGKTWEKQERLLMVASIKWSHIHQNLNRAEAVIFQDIATPSRTPNTDRLPLDVECHEQHPFYGRSYYQEGYETLSPSGSLATMPDGWLDGEELTFEEPY